MSAAEELGPALPPRGVMRAKAQEAHQLVLILLETTVAGGDLGRAARTFRKLQAVVGPPEGDVFAGSH
ncbi:MAG: hypothetical protein J0H88_08485 [Sphingomonadales bacterium]|nr:hypothetical protein [Sphingomonadales bacterium]